jgi:hypothetical protein
VIDTSTVNWIADTPGAYEAVRAATGRGDLEVLYVHDVADEAQQTKDPARRERLAAILRGIGRMVPAGAFALDFSRLDMARLGGPDDVPTVEALRSGGNIRHTRDALLSFTALREGCALLTHEKRRQPNRARDQGIEVLSTDQFSAEIGFVR